MDREAFDALTQRVARQTTRRAALSALLGGLFLLHAPAESDATARAQRRKRRRRQKRRRQARLAILKPISVSVRNPGLRTVTGQHGWWKPLIPSSLMCVETDKVQIRSGETRIFRSPTYTSYFWLNDKYWVDFQNPILSPPGIKVAVNGRLSHPIRPSDSCPRRGTTIQDFKSLKVGQTVNVSVYGKVFTVTRNRDTNYKEFTLTLPAL